MKRVAAARRQALILAILVCALALVALPKGPPTGMPVSGGADLLVKYIFYAPEGPASGDTVTVTATVLNDGDTSSGAFSVALYVDGTLSSTQSAASLDGGGVENVTFTWTAVSALHDLKIFADSNNDVSEVYENNNNKTRTIGVDWAMRQNNPERTGYTSVKYLPRNNVTAWSKTVGDGSGIESDLNIVNGVNYFATYNYVLAYNLSTGNQIWNCSLGDDYTLGGSAIYNGLMFIGTYIPTKLFALNITTDSLTCAQRKVFNYSINTQILTSPIAGNGLVFFDTAVYGSTPYAVFSLNASPAYMTNAQRHIWNYTFSGGGSEMAYDYENDFVYFSNYDGTKRIFALNASTASMLAASRPVWNYTITDFIAPVIHNGMLIVSMIYAESNVTAFNKTTGAKLWSYDTGDSNNNGPAIWNDTVYVGTSGGNVIALDASTGSLKWSVSNGDSLDDHGITVSSDGMLFVSGLGGIYVRNASTGSLMWFKSTQGFSNPGTSVALAKWGGSRWAVFGDNAGKLYVFEGRPDVNVTAVSSSPSTLYHGDTASITATVKEWESGADAFNVTFYVDNVPQSTQRVSSLDYLQMQNLTFTWTAQGGSHTIKMSADSGNELNDRRRSDNNRSVVVDVLRNSYAVSPANGTIVDRDGASGAYDDYVTLKANLSDGADGVNMDFYADRSGSGPYDTTWIYLGSNTTVNGVAMLTYTPTPSTDYAGKYEWYTDSIGTTVAGAGYFNLYGGLNTGFKSNSTMPNTAASYQSGDTVEVAMNLTSMGPETEQDLFNDYNATVSATLTPPTGAPITFALQNRTNRSASLLGSGTVLSACDGGSDDYVDFNDDLVPSPVPEGPWCGGPALIGYNVGWTCGGACVGQAGKQYTIRDADDSGFAGCGGSWNGEDFFMLQGFDVTAACPDVTVNGWTFNITGTEYDWYGGYLLATEGGTWSASGNASAAYFFTNGTSRTFVVTGAPAPAPAPAPSGGSGIFRNITVEARNNIAIEAGVNKLALGRGTSEPIDITIENTGSVVLQDIYLTAEGLPYDWVTITPSKIDSLGQNERRTVKVVINIPDYAGFGAYPLVFTVHNVYARAEIPIEVTVTAQCPSCPAPGEWSACTDGKQARAAYRCGSQTGYKCEPWAEERECRSPINNAALLLTATAIGAVALQKFYFRKKPAAPQEQPEEGPPSPAFQPGAPSS